MTGTVSVAITFSSGTMSGETMSTAIGSRALGKHWNLGDVVPGTVLTRPFGGWKLRGGKHEDVEEAIRDVMGRADWRSIAQLLRSQGRVEVELSIQIIVEDGQVPAIALPRDIVSWCADLGAFIDIDVMGCG